MSETSPYDDEELSEHGLRVRCRGLRTRIQELEAQVKRLRVLAQELAGIVVEIRDGDDATMESAAALLERIDRAFAAFAATAPKLTEQQVTEAGALRALTREAPPDGQGLDPDFATEPKS